MATVFVTKWWLSKGIVEVETETPLDQDMVFVKGTSGPWGDYYVHKPHWHTSRAEAGLYAEELRLKRIDSLKSQLGKLENLSFLVVL